MLLRQHLTGMNHATALFPSVGSMIISTSPYYQLIVKERPLI